MKKLPFGKWEHFAEQIDEPFVRRPVFGAAVSLILGIWLGARQLWWLLILFSVIMIGRVIWIAKKTLIRVLFITSVFLMLLGYVLIAKERTNNPYIIQLNNAEESVFCDLTGQIRRVHKTDYGIQYELKNVSGKDFKLQGNYHVLVRSKEKTAQYEAGDTIRVMGDASGFQTPRNPGEFDQKTYYAALKVAFFVRANRIERIATCKNPIQLLANHFSKGLSWSFYQIASPKYASVFEAMILGNRDELDEELYNLFSVCGIGHILAISGLHISMLGMSLYKLLRRLGLRPVPGMIMGGAVIIFYGLVTGNGVSTTRALIMYLVAVYSYTQKRSYDVLTAASLAAILMLMDSPMYLFHCGFLLSYGAILGITILSPAMEELIPCQLKQNEAVWQRAILKCLRAFGGSLSISFVTLPITLYFYFQTPVLAVFLNLIVIPLMTIVMASALAGGLGSFMNVYLASFLIGPAVMILKFYEVLCSLMLQIPWSIIYPGRPKNWQIVLYYMFLLVTIICLKKIQKKKMTMKILGVVLLFVSLPVLCIRIHNGLQIVFLDVGQGDGIYIKNENNISILVDGGSLDKSQLGKNILKQFLLSEGKVEVDYWIMTHADADHINGTQQLLQKGEIRFRNVILPDTDLLDDAYKKVIQLARQNGANVMIVSKGDALMVGDCSIMFLHPEAAFETEERNTYSTSFLLKKGEFDMLCCGDIAKEQEGEILDELFEKGLLDDHLEVLKANHHGSRYSNSKRWIDSLQPDYFIISSGKGNAYGHPHREVLERISDIEAKVLRTDEGGAVLIYTDGYSTKVNTFIRD